MNLWHQAAAILAATAMLASARAQPPPAAEPQTPRQSATPPNRSAPWQPQWKLAVPESRRAYDAHTNRSAQSAEATPIAPAPAAAGQWAAPRFEDLHQRAFARRDFDDRFAPTRRYNNLIQQTVNEWFYRTHDLIYTWYGGFHSWQREFDETINQILFGRLPPVPQDESFFGQPRFKTNLDHSGATIRIDVPFGR
jgi:hypothetical protein